MHFNSCIWRIVTTYTFYTMRHIICACRWKAWRQSFRHWFTQNGTACANVYANSSICALISYTLLAWLYPLFRSIRRSLMLVSRCVCTEEFWRSVGVIAVITIRCMLYTVSNIRFLFVFLFEWIIIVREYKSFATSPSPLPFHWTDGNSNETAMRHPIKSYTWKVEAAFLIVKAYLVQCEWLLWTQMMKILCTLLYLFYFFPPYKNWREKKRTKSFQIDELHTFFLLYVVIVTHSHTWC